MTAQNRKSAHLSLLDGCRDGGDIVIHQNHVRSLLGNVRPRYPHGNPDVGGLRPIKDSKDSTPGGQPFSSNSRFRKQGSCRRQRFADEPAPRSEADILRSRPDGNVKAGLRTQNCRESLGFGMGYWRDLAPAAVTLSGMLISLHWYQERSTPRLPILQISQR